MIVWFSIKAATLDPEVELVRLFLLVLSPEHLLDMALEVERKILAGSGDLKEEESEEGLVVPLTTVREQCEQLEKSVKAQEQLEICVFPIRQKRLVQRSSDLHAHDHCVAHKLFDRLK